MTFTLRLIEIFFIDGLVVCIYVYTLVYMHVCGSFYGNMLVHMCVCCWRSTSGIFLNPLSQEVHFLCKKFIYVFWGVCVNVMASVQQCLCGDQRRICGTLFFPFTMWV